MVTISQINTKRVLLDELEMRHRNADSDQSRETYMNFIIRCREEIKDLEIEYKKQLTGDNS